MSFLPQNQAFEHQAGLPIECKCLKITLNKEPAGVIDAEGRAVMKCGFSIWGGVDQDTTKCPPNNYADHGIYVSKVAEDSPASKAGLKMHDKILQCNGYDFTMVTHSRAVKYIQKAPPTFNMLVARKGVTDS